MDCQLQYPTRLGGSRDGHLEAIGRASSSSAVLVLWTVVLFISGCASPTEQMLSAINGGDSARVSELLKDQQSLGGLDQWLTVAASRGQNQIANQLLDAGAKLDSGEALMAAAKAGHAEITKLLLDRGASINHQEQAILIRDVQYGSNNGQTYTSFQMVSLNSAGNNALSAAIISKQVAVIRLLLQRGADKTLTITYQDANVDSPAYSRIICWAAQKGHRLQIVDGGGGFLYVQNGRVFTNLQYMLAKAASIQELAQMSGDREIVDLVTADLPANHEGL